MDDERFDRLARRLGTRRALGVALGAIALGRFTTAPVAGRHKHRNCKRKRIKLRCTGDWCGDRRDVSKCPRRMLRCTCRPGTNCLANGSCGQACPPECPQAPEACVCPASGEPVCLRTNLNCGQSPQHCTTTADCPHRQACAETACGPGGGAEMRCVPLCGS